MTGWRRAFAVFGWLVLLTLAGGTWALWRAGFQWQLQDGALVVAPRVYCGMQPLLPRATRQDGQLAMSDTAFDWLISVGRDSAAAGRRRDAEHAFLIACRAAEKLQLGHAAIGEAKYQLGSHYAAIAAAGDPMDALVRSEVMRRAEVLYRDSINAFAMVHGPTDEKTETAAKGLSSLRALAQAEPRAVAQAPPGSAKASPPTQQGMSRPRPLEASVQAQRQGAPGAGLPAETRDAGQAPVRAGAKAQASPRPAQQARPSTSTQLARARQTPAEARAPAPKPALQAKARVKKTPPRPLAQATREERAARKRLAMSQATGTATGQAMSQAMGSATGLATRTVAGSPSATLESAGNPADEAKAVAQPPRIQPASRLEGRYRCRLPAANNIETPC